MKFLKTTKSKLSILIIMVMVFQVFMPMVGNVAWADGSENTETEMIEEEIIVVQEDQEDINGLEDPEELGEDLEDSMDIEDEKEEDKQDEKLLKNKIKGMAIQGIKPMSGPKDLGNIFTLESLMKNEESIEDGDVIDVTDGDLIHIKYLWDTGDQTVNPGDYAEIDIPDSFVLPSAIEDADLKVGSPEVKVGTYSIADGKIRFDFDEGIEGFGGQVTMGIFKLVLSLT